MSPIKDPRPGPSSIIRKGAGLESFIQRERSHIATSSKVVSCQTTIQRKEAWGSNLKADDRVLPLFAYKEVEDDITGSECGTEKNTQKSDVWEPECLVMC